MKKPGLACSQCGSTNTELRASVPGAGLLNSLLEKLSGAAALPAGGKLLVCKDCGHSSLVQIL